MYKQMGIAKTTIGEYEVLESGTILCRPSDNVMFHIGRMDFRIQIHNDVKQNNGREITLNINKETNVLEVDLYVKNTLQLMPSTPYQVAQYDGYYLLLSFCVNTTSLSVDEDAPVIFNYMWLKGAEVDYGKE